MFKILVPAWICFAVLTFLAGGAQDDLVQLFAGDAPPTFVVEFQNAVRCNPGGQVAALLRQRYTERATVDGLRILVLHPGSTTG